MLPLLRRRRAPVAVLSAVLATSALHELAVDGPGQPSSARPFTERSAPVLRALGAVAVVRSYRLVPGVRPARPPAVRGRCDAGGCSPQRVDDFAARGLFL
ncbi:hypothetical protein [Streptomyces sp. NPDC002133]|uniref:hypothetical protein n=1 Tax=Streptomyces sp. NPDC002133 TaxID=3154409 RepID=UPI00331CE6BF